MGQSKWKEIKTDKKIFKKKTKKPLEQDDMPVPYTVHKRWTLWTVKSTQSRFETDAVIQIILYHALLFACFCSKVGRFFLEG